MNSVQHADAKNSAKEISAPNTPNGKIQVSAHRNIMGLPAYTISAAGTPRKWGRLIRIDKGHHGLPVINVQGTERLLDEVVAETFLGSPPRPIWAMTVIHFDNDNLNCAVDNIAWQIHPAWAERQTELEIRSWMRPDHLPRFTPVTPPSGMRPATRRMHFF